MMGKKKKSWQTTVGNIYGYLKVKYLLVIVLQGTALLSLNDNKLNIPVYIEQKNPQKTKPQVQLV